MSSPVLAITGNIGSGKSTAARILHELGAIHIDADQLAREVVAPGTLALSQIVDYFGSQVLNSQGNLDRKKLGAVVFEQPEARKKLESITHPQIQVAMMQALAEAQQQHPPLILLEIPLLFEGNLHKQFPHTLLITAPDDLRRQRIMARDGISEAETNARIDSQMPQEDKTSLATWVVCNESNLQELKEKLVTLWPTLTGQNNETDN